MDSAKPPAEILADLKVLVVDDLSTVRKVVAKLLLSMGIKHVAQAKDGVDALEKIRSDRPDVLVTDWEMPNLNGIELIRQIRADPALATLPALLITSRGERERVVEAVASGVSDFIVKPFGEDVLREKILRVLTTPPPSSEGK